jgi:fatty acid synthase subunit alpha, fungi type
MLKQTFAAEKVKEMLSKIVQSFHAKALDQQKAEGQGYIKLERGVCNYISLSAPGAGGAAGGGGGGAVINNKEFIKFQADQQKFAVQRVESYMHYLRRDSRAADIAFDQEKVNSSALQAKLDSIIREHGEVYIEGIQSRFDVLQAHHFDSSWNWVCQDALLMFYDIIFRRLTPSIVKSLPATLPSSILRDPDMLRYMQYNVDHMDPSKGDTYKLAKEFGQQLIDNTWEVAGKPPVYQEGKLKQVSSVYIILMSQ